MKWPWHRVTEEEAPRIDPVQIPDDPSREIRGAIYNDQKFRDMVNMLVGAALTARTADLLARAENAMRAQMARALKDKGGELKEADRNWLAAEVGRRLATSTAYHLRQYHDGERPRFPDLGPGVVAPELRTLTPEQLGALVGADGGYVVVEIRESLKRGKGRKRVKRE